jgi:hypothetical protein
VFSVASVFKNLRVLRRLCDLIPTNQSEPYARGTNVVVSVAPRSLTRSR